MLAPPSHPRLSLAVAPAQSSARHLGDPGEPQPPAWEDLVRGKAARDVAQRLLEEPLSKWGFQGWIGAS